MTQRPLRHRRRNGSGFQPASTLERYGLLIWDWAHAADVWINREPRGSPIDNGAVLAEQCARAKQANPDTRY